MEYTIAEITNEGVAKIQFNDGSYTFIELKPEMTEAEVDDAVWWVRPNHLKTGGSAPSFLTVGAPRIASEKPIEDVTANDPQWLKDRIDAYGPTSSQIEYITENGLEAWQAHVAQIKADNPEG
jgi:hypothetical protein